MRNCVRVGCRCSLLPSGEGAPQGRMRVRAKPLALQPLRVASPRTLTPTPLPQERGCRPPRCSGPERQAGLPASGCATACAWAVAGHPLPSGEGAPQGRMRVRAKPLALQPLQVASPRTLTPTTFPQERGCSPPRCSGPERQAGLPAPGCATACAWAVAVFPSPIGRRCPAGADEGTCEASGTPTTASSSAPHPHPYPSPAGEGMQSAEVVAQAVCGFKPLLRSNPATLRKRKNPASRRGFCWKQIA